MKKVVFIGGPITHMIDDGKFNTKYKFLLNNIILQLEHNYNVVSAYITENYGKTILKNDEETTKRDLNWIEDADICVFIFPFDVNNKYFYRSDGMFVEIGYAVARQKKILLFTDIEKFALLSPMIRGLVCKNVYYESIHNLNLNVIKKYII